MRAVTFSVAHRNIAYIWPVHRRFGVAISQKLSATGFPGGSWAAASEKAKYCLAKTKQARDYTISDLLFCLERVTGVEPASSAWKAEVLPLNHTRICWSGRLDSNQRPSAPKADALPNCATPRNRGLTIRENWPLGKSYA